MKSLFATDPLNWTPLTVRLTLAIVIFPHGAQKLFGWFGGYGFTGTMGFLTGTANLPWIIAFLVIFIESIGSLCILLGLATRFFAFAMFVLFVGIIITSHLQNGFFMNWASEPNRGEGFEFHLLVLGLSLSLLISGSGRWGIDTLLARQHSRDL